jgi:flagellar hook-length control protein FliK
MNALVMQLQAQTTADVAGQAVRPAARMTDPESGRMFVRLLQQAAGADGAGQGTTLVQASGESAPASGMVPANLLAALLSGQSGSEGLSALVGQLLAALDADGGLTDRLLEEPLFAEWLAEAMALLLSPVSTDPAVTVPSAEAGGETTGGLIQTILIRLADRLASGEADAAAETAAHKLQGVLDALAGKMPLLQGVKGDAALKTAAAAPENATAPIRPEQAQGQAVSKPQPADGNGQTVFRVLETAVKTDDSASRQLLDRLVHMNPNAALKAAETTDGAVSTAEAAQTRETNVPTQAVNPSEGNPLPAAAFTGQAVSDRAADIQIRQPGAQTAVMNARQFAEEMADFVVRQFTVTRTGIVSEAKISLVPEHLGQLDVKISVANGMVTAEFTAENAGARGMLELQLPMLRAALEQQGLQVDRLVVSQQQAGGPASGHFQDDRGRQAGNQERRQNGSREASIEAESFELLLDADESYGGEMLYRYGSTFHATA